MRETLSLLLALAHAGQFAFEVTNHCPRFVVVDRTKAVDARPLVTLVKTLNCPYCEQQEGVLTKMPSIRYDTRTETRPHNKYDGYPVLELAGRRPLVGYHDKAAVWRWVEGK